MAEAFVPRWANGRRRCRGNEADERTGADDAIGKAAGPHGRAVSVKELLLIGKARIEQV